MKHEPRPAIHMEKQFGCPRKLESGGDSGDLLGRSNSVSQVDGVSDMAPACWLCGGRFRKGTMASAHIDARHFHFSLYTTGPFQAAILLLELRGSA